MEAALRMESGEGNVNELLWDLGVGRKYHYR